VRAALSATGAPFEERDFFREPFTEEELRSLAGDRPISDLFATRSPSVNKLGLDPGRLREPDMLSWMLREPRLIRRPWLAVDGSVFIQPNVRDIERLVT
jgi:arsenate reductase-like glutaredoxin family protein